MAKKTGRLCDFSEFGYHAGRTHIATQKIPVLDRIIAATLNSYRGLRHAFLTEAAFREEVIALLLALPIGWFIAPSPVWYLAMIGALLVVMAVELLNTGIEKLSDHVTPSHHPAIGRVKDYGSAAVFCALLLAALVWLMALAIRVGLI